MTIPDNEEGAPPGKAAPPSQAITTRTASVWLGDDMIVRIVSKEGVNGELEDAMDGVWAYKEVTGGAPRPLLIDMTGSRSISREAREYYASLDIAPAVALLATSPLARVLANFVIGLYGSAVPTKVFDDEAGALAWLGGYCV